jgi:hypothetical protein
MDASMHLALVLHHQKCEQDARHGDLGVGIANVKKCGVSHGGLWEPSPGGGRCPREADVDEVEQNMMRQVRTGPDLWCADKVQAETKYLHANRWRRGTFPGCLTFSWWFMSAAVKEGSREADFGMGNFGRTNSSRRQLLAAQNGIMGRWQQPLGILSSLIAAAAVQGRRGPDGKEPAVICKRGIEVRARLPRMEAQVSGPGHERRQELLPSCRYASGSRSDATLQVTADTDQRHNPEVATAVLLGLRVTVCSFQCLCFVQT